MSDQRYEEVEFQSNFSGGALRRIAQFAKPHRKWFVFFLLCAFLTSLCEASFLFVDKMAIDNAIIPGKSELLFYYAKLLAIVTVGQALSVFGFIFLSGMITEKIMVDLRYQMFSHLQKLSLSYFSVTPVGWIMSRVNSDSSRIADLLTWGLVDTCISGMNILISGAFMFYINWRMTLIVLAVLPLMLYIAWQFRKRILAEYRNVRKLNSKVTGAFNENITGARVVKALQREDRNLGEFDGLTTPMFRSAYRAARYNAMFLPSIQILGFTALGIILWNSDVQLAHGWMTIGGIQAFIGYVMQMVWPVADLARVYGEMQQSIAASERVFSLLDAKPSIVNRPDAVTPETICGDIAFDHVTFYYDDGDGTPVLKDFSLEVKQGEMIALVGSTGGGKTTIVNLMSRFYEPKEGEIRICGRDYREYKMESIQSQIGMVLQTPHLFSGTIRENLRYGRLNATDEEIEDAAIRAGADEFIRSFPLGYEEQVGEGGNLLSVGQKQLISLARAILADPVIFIMDEATSSVDTVTEHLIQQGMETMMAGRTSFIIAHRLSTIKRADRILVIENGSVAEEGNHKALLAKRGKYFSLYTQQFRQEQEQAISSAAPV